MQIREKATKKIFLKIDIVIHPFFNHLIYVNIITQKKFFVYKIKTFLKIIHILFIIGIKNFENPYTKKQFWYIM